MMNFNIPMNVDLNVRVKKPRIKRHPLMPDTSTPKPRTVKDIKLDLQNHNFSLVYDIPDNYNKPDLRNKANKIDYFNKQIELIKYDVNNLVLSGAISQDDAVVILSKIKNLPVNITKADITKAINIRNQVLDTALKPEKVEKLPIDKIRIQQYLNSDVFYYFSHFAPEASRIIRKIAHDNPQEFLRMMNDNELPDEFNVSEWDDIVARIFENPDVYKSEEQQEKVRQEFDNYEKAIHKKRPWATNEKQLSRRLKSASISRQKSASRRNK